MATRSRIAVIQDDGTIQSVYCHWDGYPEHNGKMLVENYRSKEQADELLSYGSISSLAESIEASTFHSRDHGEELDPPKVHYSLEHLLETWNGAWEEYLYLWKEGKWLILADYKGGKFENLRHHLKSLESEDASI